MAEQTPAIVYRAALDTESSTLYVSPRVHDMALKTARNACVQVMTPPAAAIIGETTFSNTAAEAEREQPAALVATKV